VADFSTSACFVEGSLDEDRLRCTVLPDGIMGKIIRAFSFKNFEALKSSTAQYTSYDGFSLSKVSLQAWWKNKRGLDIGDVNIVLDIW
jgi:hypothetical protein